jgi:putative transposase
MVDKFGLPLAIGLSGAEASDGLVGIELLWKLESNSRLELIRADGAYKGSFVEAAKIYNWRIEFGQKPESTQGFVPQIGRWQVERSFAWLNFFRRLSKEYEKTIGSAIAFLQLAFIQILLNRLENRMILILSLSLSMIYLQFRFS